MIAEISSELLLIFITSFLICMAFIAVVNTLLFPRLQPTEAPQELAVSVLIPARNEAATIGHTIRSILDQANVKLEVLVLDDHSTDGTADVACAAGNNDPRLRVISGHPLPEGWGGKNWACHQLAALANHDWMLFIDADVQFRHGALGGLLRMGHSQQADLLSVWSTQITQTASERFVVPLMAFAIFAYLPLPLVHHSPFAAFSAANGQCMLFRKAAYKTIDGHQSVRNNITEDIALARQIKKFKLRLRMADGAGQILCRMYDQWSAVRNGFAKNILKGHADSMLLLGLSTVFHWFIFVWPVLWWLFDGQWAGFILYLLAVTVRALSAAATKQRLIDALAMPISVMIMTRIAAHALWWRWRFGGPYWKGRVVG
jgi:chlorobactene glucosyltransferase